MPFSRLGRGPGRALRLFPGGRRAAGGVAALPAGLLTGLAASLVLTLAGSAVSPPAVSQAAAPLSAGHHAGAEVAAQGAAVGVETTAAARLAQRRRGVSTRWSSRVAEEGERVLFRGTVPRRHWRAVLQQRVDGRWVSLDRGRTRHRHYRFRLATDETGRFVYRVLAPVTKRQRRHGVRAARSARTVLRVVATVPQPPTTEPTVEKAPAAGSAGWPAPLGDPDDYSYIHRSPARWDPCDTITYRVNTTYGPRSGLQDVKGAVARVEAATGLDFEYVGSTRLVPQSNSGEGYPRDTQVVIAWASRSQSPMIGSESVAGVAGPRGWWGNVEPDGTPVLTWNEGTVVLNSAFNGLEPGFGTGTTMGKLVMHELGHVVGLGHAATEPQVMYPVLQREYPSAWGAGDLSGLVSLGAEQGCLVRPADQSSARRGGGVSVVAPVIRDGVRDLDEYAAHGGPAASAADAAPAAAGPAQVSRTGRG